MAIHAMSLHDSRASAGNMVEQMAQGGMVAIARAVSGRGRRQPGPVDRKMQYGRADGAGQSAVLGGGDVRMRKRPGHSRHALLRLIGGCQVYSLRRW